MSTIAYLTMESLAGFECDDPLTVPPLAERGIHVIPVPWDHPTDWSSFDAVIVRSPWDYQKRFAEFMAVLREIDRSGTPLWNPLPLMEWNLHKSYLLQLQDLGVPIVPTIRGTALTRERLLGLPADLQSDEIVIKPIVGAGAHRTHRLKLPFSSGQISAAVADHIDSEYLAQPFLDAIVNEGEYSLIYFGGHFSHAIRKTPKLGDFRSQEEFGSQLTSVSPNPQLLEAAGRVLAALTVQPLYARVDLVRYRDQFVLMEVELVEPALYLSKSPGAAERFAECIQSMLTRC